MEIEDVKKSLNKSRFACKTHIYELEAHRKTLAIELARLEQDLEKAQELFEELNTGLAALSRFQSD